MVFRCKYEIYLNIPLSYHGSHVTHTTIGNTYLKKIKTNSTKVDYFESRYV